MSLRLKIVAACLAVGLVAIALQFFWSLDELRTRSYAALESDLVDSANLLAPLAIGDPDDGRPDPALLARIWRDAQTAPIAARIHGTHKEQVEIGAYCCDANGQVLWHSEDPSLIGADFSQWNDVIRCLRGDYGARATPIPGGGPMDAILHVAAPVREGERIVGLVTVFKEPGAIEPLERSAIDRALLSAAVLAGLVVLLGLALGLWISGPLAALSAHLRRLRDGSREPTPRLPGEVGQVAAALAELRAELDGRRYAEDYVQGLTHELKSPLAAIAAHAELLEDEGDAAQAARFLQRIQQEGDRMRALIDRMLDLAALERREALGTLTTFPLAACLAKHDDLAITGDTALQLHGDRLLIEQAIGNLIANARSVSDQVTIDARREAGTIVIAISDRGPGLPDYAIQRLGQRFFRAPIEGRPRGHGLGLAFVSEVTRLHGGSWSLANRDDGPGAIATLRLPAIS